MKKSILFLLFAFSVLSCGKESPSPVPVPPTPVTFLLDASFSDGTYGMTSVTSKAVQTDWEPGNVIFVFFDDVASPKYLEMKYDGSSWSYTEKNGSLNLTNGHSGNMRAVYLPFGNDASVSADGTSFKFSNGYTSFYLTASLPYTVTNNTISGKFKMSVPDGYVQFYVADETAVDGAYKLATDAVKPVEISAVAANGTPQLAIRAAGGNMPGYVYKKGYLFSGIMSDSYPYGSNFYFAKTKVSDNSRSDYFVTGKSLSNRKSVILPDNGNNKWEPVTPNKTVKLAKTIDGVLKSYGVWYTCNNGAEVPEDIGSPRVDFEHALALVSTNNILPSFELLNQMVADLSWIPISVHGKPGMVVNSETGFIFLPVHPENREDYYWSRKELDGDHAYHLYINMAGSRIVSYSPKSMQYPARYLYAEQ